MRGWRLSPSATDTALRRDLHPRPVESQVRVVWIVWGVRNRRRGGALASPEARRRRGAEVREAARVGERRDAGLLDLSGASGRAEAAASGGR